MNNTTLLQLAAKSLPALSGESVTYNAQKNVFLTQGYTSNAGNMYYKAIRLSSRLLVCCELGQGYSLTFLNGLTLYAYDGKSKNMIGRKTWGGSFNWVCYSERFVREQCIQMLTDYMKGQMKMLGQSVNEQELQEFSRSMVEETERRLL